MTTPTSYSVSGVITNAGITAAIQAGTAGPQINITGFRIGSASAVDGAVALVTDTDVDSFVYQGTAAQVSYLIIDADSAMFRIELDTTVGNFSVGNIGLTMANNVLFAKAVMPAESVKYMSIPPTTVGNIKFYNIVMRLANIASLINLTIIESLTAAIPEVASELALPPALSSPFDAYMVDNHTHVGVPTTALRLNGNWYHSPHRLYPGQGQCVIACSPGLFASNVTVPSAVYLNTGTELFTLADGANPSTAGMGMCTSTFEVTVSGQVPGTLLGVTGTLSPGTLYYVNTASLAGKLTTAPIGQPVAVAVSTTDIFLNFDAAGPWSAASSIPVATTTARGIARWATNSEATSFATSGSVPAFVTPEELGAVIAALPSAVSPPVATTTARGVAREATGTEATAGAPSGSAPAFITPEELGAAVAALEALIAADIAAVDATIAADVAALNAEIAALSGNPFQITSVGAVVITSTTTYPVISDVGTTTTDVSFTGGEVLFETSLAVYECHDTRFGAYAPGTWQLVNLFGVSSSLQVAAWIRIA